MMRATSFVLLISCLALTGACGDDPLSFSGPVGIELKADADKVIADSLTDEKGITTESGNPYGAFISDSRTALGGADPSHIAVTAVDVLLGANSTGVTALGQIFDGNFEVVFEMNDTNDTVIVANGTISSEAGTSVALTSTFDSDTLSADNYVKLLGGSFKVVYRSPTQIAYAATDAKANLQITFTFESFE